MRCLVHDVTVFKEVTPLLDSGAIRLHTENSIERKRKSRAKDFIATRRVRVPRAAPCPVSPVPPVPPQPDTTVSTGSDDPLFTFTDFLK
ncbi:hypothetical protein JYU34_009683 [Plutella xylostella]|uniref:Uncharacterized protein n=1 Tax=Plutella xylostella TaxID=51655 RepID=A0ABQ7QK65_PLUXY|nr:hypothetical protein JYU34_009683 [Plutella xylostella]